VTDDEPIAARERVPAKETVGKDLLHAESECGRGQEGVAVDDREHRLRDLLAAAGLDGDDERAEAGGERDEPDAEDEERAEGEAHDHPRASPHLRPLEAIPEQEELEEALSARRSSGSHPSEGTVYTRAHLLFGSKCFAVHLQRSRMPPCP